MNDLMVLSNKMREMSSRHQFGSIIAILLFLREKGIMVLCKNKAIYADESGYYCSTLFNVDEEMMAHELFCLGITAEDLFAALQAGYNLSRKKIQILLLIIQLEVGATFKVF